MTYCVCIPARNEARRLPRLLDALVAQDVAGRIPVAICINNSDDASAAIVADHAARHPRRLAIALDVCTLPEAAAHVGSARRRAMEAGATIAGPDGVLIATDADCRPPPSWIAATLAAMTRGVDIVGGRIVIDGDEPVDPAILALRDRFDLYWAQVRAIEDAIDPIPHDPAPRHGDHTGASLAIRVARYRAAGGVPLLRSGEDRALVAAALATGGRLAHPPGVWTRTSARRSGRAPGGMAEAMATLADQLAAGFTPHVPAFAHWQDRARWRAAMRADPATARDLSLLEALLPPMPLDLPLPIVRADAA